MTGNPHHPKIAALLFLAAVLSNLTAAVPYPSPSPFSQTPTNATVLPANSAPTTSASPKSIPNLVLHDIPDIHGKISLPSDWTLLPGKLLEGDVLLAVREKIANENDPWTTGLSMTIDRNGAKDSGMKAGDYALGIAKEGREKAGEEATPISDSTKGAFREIRFEFPVQTDTPLQVTEILRANDQTGTVAVILWQSPKSEASALHDLREAMLTDLALDPAQ